jgi:hypothetical protein
MKVAFFLCPACIIRNFGKSGRINGDLKDYKTMKRNDRVSIKIIVLGKITRLRASPRHGGREVFLKFFPSLIRRGGAPSGAAALIVITSIKF